MREFVHIGVGHDEGGVYLYVQDGGGKSRNVFTVEPEFARLLAERLTLRSFECEDLRRKNQGEG